MSSNRLLIFFLLVSIASASVVSEKKNGDIFLNNFEVLFKSSSANQSVIKDIVYNSPSTLTSVKETKGQNKLEIKNTTVIEDSVSPANKSVELFKLLRQGNIYSFVRSMQRQCGCDASAIGFSAAALVIGLGAAAAATAIGVGVGVGVPAAIEAPEPLDIIVARFACQETPENNLNIPDDGPGFPDRGCGKSSIRFGGNVSVLGKGTKFEGGFCAPLLKRGPCTSPFQWVTIDPKTFQVLLTDDSNYFGLLLMAIYIFDNGKGSMFSTSMW